jgi:hypothetical protein
VVRGRFKLRLDFSAIARVTQQTFHYDIKQRTSMTPSTVAASMPPTTPMPIARRLLATAPVEIASGSTLRPKTIEVIRIGRSRILQASIVAAINPTLSFYKCTANCMMRIAFFTDKPRIAIIPILNTRRSRGRDGWSAWLSSYQEKRNNSFDGLHLALRTLQTRSRMAHFPVASMIESAPLDNVGSGLGSITAMPAVSASNYAFLSEATAAQRLCS